jgi:Flp pilus assembly protein TadG
MTQIPTLLVRLARDERGASVIETAIVLPILLTLMAGASDFAMAFWLKMETQQAAARAMEYATSGGLENLSVKQLRAEAAAAAEVPVANVTVLRRLECNGITQSLFEGSCADGQVTGRFVSVRITNTYEPILGPFLPDSIANQGSMSFTGFSTLRLQ